MATIVHTRELMLQNTDYLATQRDPKNFYTATQPWTNKFTNADNPAVTNITKTLFAGIKNPFDDTGSTRFIATNTTGTHSINSIDVSTPNFVSGGKVHQIVYVKNDGSSQHRLACRLSTNGTTPRTLQYIFNPATGTFVSSTLGTGGWSAASGTATLLDDNWWKVVISATFTVALDENIIRSSWLLTDTSNQTSFTGNNSSGLYLYGFQTYYNVELPETVIGDTWYDAIANTTKIWNGYNFITIGGTSTIYDIESTVTAIYKDSFSAGEPGAYSSFTVTGKKIVGTTTTTYGFLTVTGDGDTEAVTASADSIVTSPSTAAGKSSYEVKLYDTTAKTTLLKALTIPVVFKGNPSIAIDLLSESDVVPAAANGTQYTLPPSNSVRLYSGGLQLTSGVTYSVATASVSGLTAGVNASTGVITFSGNTPAWTSDSAVFTFNAAYSGTTYTTSYSVAKSKTGSNAILIDLQSEADIVPAANDGTGYTLPPSNSLRLYSGGTQITSGIAFSVSTAVVSGLTASIGTSTGTITFAGTAWASDSAAFTFNAVYAGTTYTASYSVAKSKQGTAGVNGSNAILVDLQSESDIVPAANDGTGYSLPPSNSLRLYSGGTQITSGIAFSVSTAVVSGLTASIGTSTGTITFAGTAWTSDSAAFTFNAVYSGTTYTASYSVAKSKQGTAGANAIFIDLQSEADIVPAANDGTGYTLPPSNSLRLYSGGTQITSGIAFSVSTAVVSGLTASIGTSTGTITFAGTAWTSDSAAFTFNAVYAGGTYTASYSVAKSKQGTQGVTGDKTALVYLYKWNTTTPSAPTGNSTYTWAIASHSGYTGSDWSDSVGTNPNTPGVNLWVAALSITVPSSVTTTPITWNNNTSVSVYSVSSNVPGTRTATAVVYKWALTIPAAPTDTTYLTWSTGAYLAPTGWSLTPGTSTTAGYTLWGAAVNLLDSSTVTTSAIAWSTASVTARGYAGLQGGSVRTAYARITANPAALSSTAIVAGDTRPTTVTAGNFIIGAIYTIVSLGTTTFTSIGSSANTVGTVFTATGVGTGTGTAYSGGFGAPFQVTWSTTDPDPTSTSSLYQADGIYNPSTNQTTWASPYISSLKVGSLSAITVNTGDLTVNGGITMTSTGSIAGGQTAYSTGNGFFLGYSGGAYKFSIGNGSDATKELTWDGTALSIPSAAITGTLTANQIAANAITASKLTITDLTNIADNGDFEAGNVGWSIASGSINLDATNAKSGSYVLAMTQASGSSACRNLLEITVYQGEEYYAEAWIRCTGTASGYVRLRGKNNSGVENWTPAGNTVTATTYTLSSVAAAVPSATVKLNVELVINGGTGTVYVDNVRLLRRVNGNVVVDGSITATKINARGLSILDENGNTILSAGASVSASTFNGAVSNNATIGGTTASALVSTANAAYSTAGSAATTASSALTTASSAATTASAAQTTASSAATTASAAQATASSAATTASNALATASSAASTASAAQTAAADRLSKSARNVLAGNGGLAVGTLTWNTATGAYASGTGLGITSQGIVAYRTVGATTVPTFSISSTGDAEFGGSLNAATGTFSGSLNVASAASGQRLVITPTKILVYDANNVIRVKIGDLA